jgi:hypothetical protein
MVTAAALLVAGGVAAATLLGFGPAGGAALGPPRFVDETDASGLEHRYDGEFLHVVGGGVAAFDCDDDGFQDLYLAGGSQPAALYRNRSASGGDLRFERLEASVTDLRAVTGAYPLDIDGDGRLDLAVLRVGEDVLLRGRGDCAFERANERWAFDGGNSWTTAFSATWEGDAALPTLAFGSYLALDADGAPLREECGDNELVRPASSGTTYADPIALEPGLCALSMLFSDWDRSGRRDLRVSNDRHYYRDGEEQLWRIEEDEIPRRWRRDEGWASVQLFGMGIASQDLTGDGYPEVYLTSQADNKLQTAVDPATGPAFEDMALEAGVTAHRPYAGDVTLPSTAWHPEFADVNNDGFMDLFVSKGNVEAQLDHAMRDPNNLLLGQPEVTFVEAAPAAGIVRYERGRGAALVDLNLDGLLDLVVVNRREPVRLWRNVGSGDGDGAAQMGQWVAVRLAQPAPNPDAVGAWVKIEFGDRVLWHEVTVGGGHAGGQTGWIHVGIGSADEAEVTITWPDGTSEGPIVVVPGTWSRLERGSGRAEPWSP